MSKRHRLSVKRVVRFFASAYRGLSIAWKLYRLAEKVYLHFFG
jgi:hypothetical protein